MCRSPHGERGLKSREHDAWDPLVRRSPHGERGLKYPKATAPSLAPTVALLTESVD